MVESRYNALPCEKGAFLRTFLRSTFSNLSGTLQWRHSKCQQKKSWAKTCGGQDRLFVTLAVATCRNQARQKRSCKCLIGLLVVSNRRCLSFIRCRKRQSKTNTICADEKMSSRKRARSDSAVVSCCPFSICIERALPPPCCGCAW